MTLPSKFSIIPRLSRWMTALAGIGLASTPVAAQSLTVDRAPAEWVRYAQGTTEAITYLLQGESESATRLRTYLDATRPASDQPTAPLLLRIWVDKNSVISRMEHAAFAHAEPNADLRALLVGAVMPGSPPREMLLPLRIQIQLPPSSIASTPDRRNTSILSHRPCYSAE